MVLIFICQVGTKSTNASARRALQPNIDDSGVNIAPLARSTCGLVAMTSASHAEGRQFDPGQVYNLFLARMA